MCSVSARWSPPLLRLHQGPKGKKRNLLACLPVAHPRGRRREDSIINRKGPTANKQGPAVPYVPPPPNRIAVYFLYLVKIQISLNNFRLPTSLVPFVRRPWVILLDCTYTTNTNIWKKKRVPIHRGLTAVVIVSPRPHYLPCLPT
ncbi:hypothetical protein LZ31DRAFT_14662 [Colletotrichum somersetense]|nr:hypothetical protein LZ31DRAFT_14662 [Colletotrichum somersetense]